MSELILILMSSVISYGCVEIMKPLVRRISKERGVYYSLLRLLSAITGGFMGYELGWLEWHIWLGVGSGILNSWVVALLKEKVEDKLGVEIEEDKREP
jgi:L-asparagine transporter-like permease